MSFFPLIIDIYARTVFLERLMKFVVLKRTGVVEIRTASLRKCRPGRQTELAAETVQSAALPFQCVDDVHGGDGLTLGVFGIGDSVPDDVLEEHLQHASGLLVDEAGDTLDSTATCQSSDGGLRDSLDVVPEHFAMSLGATFAQTFASFTSSGHDDSSSFDR